jgi:aromatic ring-opening dioxygenase catalytic subunit (LigB family)
MPDTAAPASRQTTPRMPSFYVPHGAGPCFFMDWDPPGLWDSMRGFLRAIPSMLPQRPRAIVVVTSHWLAPAFTVGSGRQPTMLYDYRGFPPHTYELHYEAPGDPALAQRIAGLLQDAGLPSATDAARGFDHGTFIPLMLMFPTADIPLVQLSLRHDLNPQAHLAVGAALAPLRDEDVLIVGSGMSFHNMRAQGDARFVPISDAFDDWLTKAVESAPPACRAALAHWEDAPGARLCHPTHAEEHLLPLMVVAGTAADDAGQRVYADRCMGISLSGYRFG